MFSTAQNAQIREWEEHDNVNIGITPVEALPDKYTLSRLHDELCIDDASKSEEKVLRNILILKACLQLSDRLSREDGDDLSITQIVTWLSKAILPTVSLIPTSGDEIPDTRLQNVRQRSTAGLLTFKASLFELYQSPPEFLDLQTFLSLIAFSSLHDPWTTATSRAIANEFLDKYAPHTHISAFIVDYLLQEFVRPLFSKSKRPEAITSSGRKAMPSSAPSRRFDVADQDLMNMPWMYECPYAITVLSWTVINSTAEIAVAAFNLYVPPLLTILDSTYTPTRCRGLEILYRFVSLLPQKFLVQTGLAEVFEDAVTPTLMFLPNITPLEESVPLLEGAYNCLVQLGTVLYTNEEAKGAQTDKATKYWDRLMRNGILQGYAHSSERPAIVEVLLRYMCIVVGKTGIHAVKHLKDLIPIVAATLADPFAATNSSLILMALSSLQAIIRTCWPRISEPRYRIEIITALTICWQTVVEAQLSDPLLNWANAQTQLSATGKMFLSAIEDQVDARAELEKAFETDETLRIVFGMEGK